MSKLNKEIKGKLKKYLIDRVGAKPVSNGWVSLPECIYCGGKLKLGVRVSDWRVNCFKCGTQKDPISLVADIENLTEYTEVIKLINGYENMEFLEVEEFHIAEKKETLSLPPEYRNILLGKNQMAKIARKALKGRGFDLHELSMMGVGYCVGGYYHGYLIWPFYQKGKLIYFISRRILNHGTKFKNPKVEEFGISKQSIIYNVDCLAVYKKIYLLESVTNACTMGRNGIAIDGKVLSPYQLSLIVSSPIKEVVIILDRDAYSWALKAGLQLIKHKKVKVILMPDNKDVNDRGKKFVKKLEKSEDWASYSSLYSKYIKQPK